MIAMIVNRRDFSVFILAPSYHHYKHSNHTRNRTHWIDNPAHDDPYCKDAPDNVSPNFFSHGVSASIPSSTSTEAPTVGALAAATDVAPYFPWLTNPGAHFQFIPIEGSKTLIVVRLIFVTRPRTIRPRAWNYTSSPTWKVKVWRACSNRMRSITIRLISWSSSLDAELRRVLIWPIIRLIR